MVTRAANALVAVLVAPRCVACGDLLDRPIDGPACETCWRRVALITPPFCRRCGDPLPSWRVTSIEHETCARCRRRSGAVDRAGAAGQYEGALRAIVHALKYGRRRSLARGLADLVAAQRPDLLAGVDAVVAVPLHARRLRARGFNQAVEIARHLGPPLLPALRRVRDTRPQTDLPASQRHRNVRGAFAAAASVAGLRLLLVDDVSTTGATLDACAAALKEAGADEVRAVTAARATPTRPR